MKYKSIAYVDKPVSQIVFGTAIEPMIKGADASDLLDEVYAAGINTFDTAALYGDSEVSLGRWVAARNLHEKVVVISKGANPNQWRSRLTTYDILSDIETSFAKLQMDYIDMYFLHRDDPSVPVGSVVELLNQLHDQGRIGAFGGSNWTVERIAMANRYAAEHALKPFTISSPSFGLAEFMRDPWGASVTLTGEKSKSARDWYGACGMPVFSYSSLGRGFFSGKIKSNEIEKAKDILGMAAVEYGYPENFERLRRAEILARQKGASVSQIALAWIFAQPMNLFAVTSPSSISHLHESIAALHMELSDTQAKWLNLECEELL